MSTETAREALDRSFLEARARLVEVAALLDRLDRAPDAAGAAADFRRQALLDALRLLGRDEPARAAALLAAFSDPTSAPIPSAAGLKGAAGAWKGAGR